MQSIYTSYKCMRCKREIILISKEIDIAIDAGKYIACAYCSCRSLKITKQTDSLIECFRNSEKRR